jgi:hypothetical protein
MVGRDPRHRGNAADRADALDNRNRRPDGERLFAEVLTELLVVGEYFGEYLRPPQPPERLRICPTVWFAAEPDYPPSTCCVRVVRFGCWVASAGPSKPEAGRAELGQFPAEHGQFGGEREGLRIDSPSYVSTAKVTLG